MSDRDYRRKLAGVAAEGEHIGYEPERERQPVPEKRPPKRRDRSHEVYGVSGTLKNPDGEHKPNERDERGYRLDTNGRPVS